MRSVLGQRFGNIVSAVGVVVQFDANLFVLFLLDFLTLVVALRDVVRHQMLLGRLEGSGLGLGQNEVGNNLVLPSRMGTLSFRLFVFDVLRHETGLVGVQTRQIWIISVLVRVGSHEPPEVQQLSLVQLLSFLVPQIDSFVLKIVHFDLVVQSEVGHRLPLGLEAVVVLVPLRKVLVAPRLVGHLGALVDDRGPSEGDPSEAAAAIDARHSHFSDSLGDHFLTVFARSGLNI